MDPSGTHSQFHHGLLKSTTVRSTQHKYDDHEASGGIRAFNDSELRSHEVSLGHLGGLVSSEVSSHHPDGLSNCSPREFQYVVRPKILTRKASKQHVQQKQKVKEAPKSSTVESKTKQVTPVSFISVEETTRSDPDHLSLYEKYSLAGQVSGSHVVKPGISHFNSRKKSVDNTVSHAHRESSHSKSRAQSVNHSYKPSEPSDTQQGKLPPTLPSSSLADTTEESESKNPEILKRNYVGLQHRQSSASQIMHKSGDTNSERSRTSLYNNPAAASSRSLSQPKSEISPTRFAKYNNRNSKVESISHQGNASMPLSLHLSLTNISSTHEMGSQKPSRDSKSVKQSFEHLFEPENMKTKVKSVLNNIKFGLTIKSTSSFKYDSPLFMLGKCYHRRKDDPSTEPEDQFLKDFASRIWLTYRSHFYPIPGTKLSTDCGWGCMLRSGQMLIAQCLVTHFLGRDWRLYNRQTKTESTFYREIIRWFSDPLDAPSDKTPFSLHHLTNFGRAYNKNPGDWYGPSSVAYIFRDTFIKASDSIPVLSQLCIYVAQDCTVYIEDVNNLCTTRHRSPSLSSSSECDVGASRSSQKAQNQKWLRSVIILIPMRLGGEVTNDIYIPCVQSLLSHDNCMGIIGGRPKHSLYFLGWQDTKLIYLDPHLCREAIDTSVSDFKIETFHCLTPRKLAMRKMDPSCTVGFYIRDVDEFNHFVQEVREFISPPKQKGIYPLFTFSDGCQGESIFSQSHTSKDKRVRVTHYHVDQFGQKAFSGESEEFVVL